MNRRQTLRYFKSFRGRSLSQKLNDYRRNYNDLTKAMRADKLPEGDWKPVSASDFIFEFRQEDIDLWKSIPKYPEGVEMIDKNRILRIDTNA